MSSLFRILKGINRNIVECKFCPSVRKGGSVGCELIETLWNVNAAMGRGRIINGIELIETLWNVN